MANLKRLWDTENKKIVWAIPTSEPYKKLQVWTNDDGSKLYVYRNSQYLELNTANATVAEYGHYWKELDDETVGYYLTSEPTNLYNWDSGDEVAYRFLNYDGTVIESGTVPEGNIPVYTAETPTREATAQYTYTFSGWKPTVGRIYKKTDFKAQFTSSVNEYTVSIASNNTDYGTVDESSVDALYGTAITVSDNTITIGTGESATVITATAEEGYEFDSWGELPATVTGDLTITATFKVVMHTVTFSLINGVWDENAGDEGAFVPAASQDPLWGTISPQSVQVPDGFTFESDTYSLAFYSPDGSPSDDDAVVVNITPDQTISEYMSWRYGDISEISGIEETVDAFVVKGNVSDFPIIFFDDIDGPGE